MLQKIREKSSGWIAGVIVGLLVLTFALFGINSYFGTGTEPTVATINDTEIKSSQFQRAVYNIRQQVQRLMGESVSAEDPVFRQEALDRLINSEVMNQATYNYGMRVSDQRVYETINSLESFRSGERFEPAMYQRMLSTLGMSETMFEHQMRNDMMAEQFQSVIAESAFTTGSEVERLARLKNQTRDFQYSMISVKAFMDNIEVSDAEIQEFYQANKNDYVQPEMIKVEYLDLTVDIVAEKIELTDTEVEDYFNNNQVNYQIPERRQTWQAKIRIPKDYDGDAEADAKQKAEELVEIFKNNSDFIEVAEQHTTGPEEMIQVSISESGEMKQGVLKAEIDEVLFAMNIDDVSEPVKSDESFHVLKLLNVMEAEEKSLDDVRAQVEKDIRREKAQRKYFDLAEQVAALSYENPETLQFAADAAELVINETDFFSRESGDGLTSEPKVIQAAFSEEVLINQNNSEPIELDPERMVVVRLADRKSEGMKPLEDVREDIILSLKSNKAKQQVQELSQSLLEKTNQGSSFSEAAASLDLEVEAVEAIKRDDISINRSILRTAFRMGVPQGDKAIIDQVTMGNGDIAVIELNNVNYSEDLKGRVLDSVKAELIRYHAQMDWDGLFQQLKSNAEIKIFEDNL